MSIAKINLLLIFGCLLLFLPNLGQVPLFDWDEINFAESAREMIVSGDFLHVTINFQPFWEKPPFFMWLQAISMSVFGGGAFAARFPNAIVGCLTILTIFNVGRTYISVQFGWIWAAAFLGSFLPHFYFKSGIIDPLFNLLIFSGIISFHRSITTAKQNYALLSGVLLGLALLTKGPVAIFISFLCFFIYLTICKRWSWSVFFTLFYVAIISALVAGSWLLIEIWQNGTFFIKEFWEYNLRLFNTEDSGHGQPFFYHPLVILIGCFPVSILAITTLLRKCEKQVSQQGITVLMQVLFWVVLILFSIVKTKIVHYSSLCYLPITFLAAYFLHQLIQSTSKIPTAMVVANMILAALIAIALIAIPLIAPYKDLILPLVNDVFAKANISYPVEWNGFEFVGGVLFFGLVLIASFFSKRPITYLSILFLSVIFMMQFTFYAIIPKLERHIQGAMIDFLTAKQNEDCYVKALGFKTYATLFYTKRMPDYHANKDSENENWLMNGDIDKPVYFITKCDRDYFRHHSNLSVVLEEGGFVVYKREKP